MRTFVYMGAALAVGLVAGLAVSGHAQQVVDRQEDDGFLGVIRAREYRDSYKMPLDVGADSSFKRIDRIDEKRMRIHISNLYGPMIDMTPHGDDVVLWFRDGDDVIRNAVVKGVTSELLHIERVPATPISRTYR